MRQFGSTLLVGVVLTSTLGCGGREDLCAAASAKVSDCLAEPAPAAATCSAEDARRLLTLSCAEIRQPNSGKAIDGWAVAAIAAAVVGTVWWITSPDSSSGTGAASASTGLGGHEHCDPAQANACAPGLQCGCRSTIEFQPRCLSGTVVACEGTRPSTGPVYTNAQNCHHCDLTREDCIGEMGQAAHYGFGFRCVPKNSRCTSGNQFRICPTGGACGIEYCNGSSGSYTGNCSSSELSRANGASPGFAPFTLDKQPLTCSTSRFNSGPPRCSGGCGRSGDICTADGVCVAPRSAVEGQTCADLQGNQRAELCAGSLACKSTTGTPGSSGAGWGYACSR